MPSSTEIESNIMAKAPTLFGFCFPDLKVAAIVTCLRAWVLRPRFDVRNHFLFTPLLPSTTVGTIEFRSIIESIRVACPDVTFDQATVRTVDTEQSVITCEGVPAGKRLSFLMTS